MSDYWLTPQETLLCQLVFGLVGVCSMYYWNAVINVLYSVIVIRSPEDVVTITNVYTTVSVICAFALSVFGSATRAHYFAGGILLASMCLLFPVFAIYTTGRAQSILLHVSGAVAGAGEMLFQCSGFSFAVLLSKRFAGYVSFGYGACGVLTFCLWLLLSQVVWPGKDDLDGSWRLDDMAKAVWTQFLVGFVLILGCLGSMTYVFNLKQMKKALESAHRGGTSSICCENNECSPSATRSGSEPGKHGDMRVTVNKGAAAVTVVGRSGYLDDPSSLDRHLVSPSNDRADTEGPRRSKSWLKAQSKEMWYIFRQTWQLQIGLGLSQGISMMAYPLIGPYQYMLSPRRNDILTGVFQCGDFLGRYIPNLSHFVPCLLLPASWMLPLTVGRLSLLVIFILTARSSYYHYDDILTKYTTEVVTMAALALSHGYYGSVFMIRMTESLENPKHKVKASAMAVCLLVACIATGMWLARLVHFG